jgi:succinate-acetate transporter protein
MQKFGFIKLPRYLFPQDGKCLWLVLWGIFSFVMFLNTFRLNRALQVGS